MSAKNIDVYSLASAAMSDDVVLNKHIENIKPENKARENIRYQSYLTILNISENYPERLYDKWDVFSSLIGHDSVDYRFIAIHIIPNLVKADTENRFDDILEKYFSLLDGDSLIVSANVAKGAGKVVTNGPRYGKKVTEKLLGIDNTGHEPGRKALIKSYAIDSISQYYDDIEDKTPVVEFVKAQLKSTSPRTKKSAKAFIARHGIK